MASNPSPVVIDYSSLANLNTDLSAQLEQAFGKDGLGLLVVRSVPNYVEFRQRLLPLAAAFAALPDEVKAKYEDEASSFNVGWSCGREVLENGQPDTHKGSFYANPLEDQPSNDPELIARYPSDLAANIWPKEELPELERQFKSLGALMIETGLLLAQHCDKYVASKVMSYNGNTLTEALKASKCNKGRLLHYFPTTSNDAQNASWCGWHKDHGLLTALTSAMYLPANNNNKQDNAPLQTNTELEEQTCVDPNAGLHIKDRSGNTVKVSIGRSDLAFQVGEVMQVLSGGLLQATPHAVVAPSMEHGSNVSRNTFAVFMQPNFDQVLDPPEGLGSSEQVGVEAWEERITFGNFARAKFERYYSGKQLV